MSERFSAVWVTRAIARGAVNHQNSLVIVDHDDGVWPGVIRPAMSTQSHRPTTTRPATYGSDHARMSANAPPPAR